PSLTSCNDTELTLRVSFRPQPEPTPFWTPQNFTIPVIVTLWGLSLFATPLMELLNKKMPWYRLLVPDAKHTSTEATNDDQP
ncbi:hypothetical protein BME53_27460, partial [Klebsiella quasipneumoniae subsp. similipneumoniae]